MESYDSENYNETVVKSDYDDVMELISNNESLLKLSLKKIDETNLSLAKIVCKDTQSIIDLMKKLKGYRYIDSINELRYGEYLRWIPLSNPDDIPLHHNGILCEIKMTDKGTHITCKNFMHRHYSFYMDNCLIFQKISNQEYIILKALDSINVDEENDDISN